MKKLYLLIGLSLVGILAIGQDKTQTLRGTVNDEVSKTPIIGATIVLVREEGEAIIGTASDVDGNFKLEGVPLGRQTLKVSYLGYEEQVIPNVVVTAGKEVILNLQLTEKVTTLNEVTVAYDRTQDGRVTNNDMTVVSARSFNIEDTRRYAGAFGDPSRMAANFAGVASGNDSRNDIVIRGNSPNGMLWQLEGLNIFNPNHFGSLYNTGGPVSMLNNNVLGKSDFMTGAFPAQYGNGTSGVFDLRLRNGNNEKHEFLAQMSFNGFEAGIEGPFSKKSKASFLINYRYSTLAVFQKIGLGAGTGNATPFYQDLNFKVNVPTKNGRFTVFGMGGLSDIKLLGAEEDTTTNNLYGGENENTIVTYAKGLLGTSYEFNVSPKTFMKFTLGTQIAYDDFRGDSLALDENKKAYKDGQASFEYKKYSAVGMVVHKFDAKNSLTSGFMFDYNDYTIKNSDFRNDGQVEVPFININEQTLLSQAYSQWKHRFNTRLTLNAGVHFTHYDLNNKIALEPRAGVKYMLASNQSLSFGYGMHSQVQSVYNSFLLNRTGSGEKYPNKDLGYTRTHHFALGYENNITKNTLVKLELYYQSLYDVPVGRIASSYSILNEGASFNPPDSSNLVQNGTGYNYGAEMTLERSFSNGFYYMVTGSLFESKYKGSDGKERNTAFNTNYVVNVLAGKEFRLGRSKTKVLAFNIRGTTLGGRRLTPINFDQSKIEGEAVYDQTQAFSRRQTPYFRLDFKVSYRIEYKRSTLEFGVDMQNVTFSENVFQEVYNRRTNQVAKTYQQGFLPIPMVRFTF